MTEEKGLLLILRHRRKDSINTDVEGTGYKDVDLLISPCIGSSGGFM
jgi:hypothetical protein